jgi:antitoxin ParD1/3/4
MNEDTPLESEERALKLAKLRAALEEGEASGPATPFDFEAFLAKKLGRERPCT